MRRFQPGNKPGSIFMDFKAAVLEFFGTTTFLLLGLGGIQAGAAALGNPSPSSPPSIPMLMYIAMSMGLSLLVSAWLFYRITGGLFNPNVSLALLLTGVIGPVKFILYVIAQLVGGIAAAGLVRGLTGIPLASNTRLSAQTSVAQGVFIEMLITAALVLSVLMLAAEKHVATPFAPVGVGLTLFVGHLFAVFYTGASMNTARSFGVAAVTGFPDGHHWIYWLGPTLGSFLGAGIYSLLVHHQYWLLNPNQDTDNPHHSPDDPVVKAKAAVSGQQMERHEAEGQGPRNSLNTNNEQDTKIGSPV
ncbi:MIP/aquaporin family protein [Pleurotus pulmonarius]